MTTKIKICGMTSVEDALLAIDAGADYLGLIFVPESPRSVTMARAKEIVHAVAGRIKTVGVFRNSSLKVIGDGVEHVQFDLIQLHGDESPDDCRKMPLPVIKAVELTAATTLEQLREYSFVVDFLLLDRPKKNPSAEWMDQALRFLAAVKLPPYFFAGGLTAENVGKAVQALHPYGVDVASGVEGSPGKKDEHKLKQFCQGIRKEEVSCSH